MGKHKKRSRKFFPVIDSRISEHAVDPMTEIVGEAVSEPMGSMSYGGRLAATEVQDLAYGQKDADLSTSKAAKEQVSQNTRGEERARKNGRKPSRAKKMQRATAGDWRSVNPVPRIR